VAWIASVREAVADDPPHEDLAAAVPTLTGIRGLLAEDTASIRKLVVEVLVKAGARGRGRGKRATGLSAGRS
jgi:hypothetical protein